MGAEEVAKQTEAAEEEPVLTMKQAAAWLGVSRQRVHQLIEGGKIKGAQRGGRWLLSAAELLRFAASRGQTLDARLLQTMELQRPGDDARLRQEIVRLYVAGESVAAITRRLKVSSDMVNRTVHSSGLPSPGEVQRQRQQQRLEAVPAPLVEEIVRRYAAGQGWQHIAQAIGWKRTEGTKVRAILKWRNIALRDKSAAGKARWTLIHERVSPLSADDLARAVRRYKAGDSLRRISADLKCSRDRLLHALKSQGVPLRDRIGAIRAAAAYRRQQKARPASQPSGASGASKRSSRRHPDAPS